MEFEAFPSIPRLFRDVVITEKIDGTNAAVLIEPWSHDVPHGSFPMLVNTVDGGYVVHAQSRKRKITPDDDNYGFASWVRDNAGTLVQDLGPGRHFGEWYGAGIQRRYGLDHRRFALFNTSRWTLDAVAGFATPNMHAVPEMLSGVFREQDVRECIDWLRAYGSVAVPGFMRPEGVVVYHTAAQHPFKVLIESDELPKSAALQVAA